MSLEKEVSQVIAKALVQLWNATVPEETLGLQATKKEFEGTHTLVCFPFTRYSKLNPEQTADAIGKFLVENISYITQYNVVKGFLNLTISDAFWVENLLKIAKTENYGFGEKKNEVVIVEYSSPNTNKPLHLGHLRNNFLGYSVAEILEANGYEVVRNNLVNDRGIHICKSMLAYQKWDEGFKPGDLGSDGKVIKGDKLVGHYYVQFDLRYKIEINEYVDSKQKLDSELKDKGDLFTLRKSLEGRKDDKQNPLSDSEKLSLVKIDKLIEESEKQVPLILEAQEMLRKWEEGDTEVRELWEKMNTWVYAGFDETYKKIGVKFDKYYYESNTYLLGKDVVEEGLNSGVFFKKDNGSVWIDLKEEGLDEKLVLRGDGTSVYITQDLGTADLKYRDFPFTKSIYVVGNEQDYHFKVLQAIMKRLGRPYAEGIYHLSYGMVDLPSGKMKSREGTVVDADDLVNEMIQTAEDNTRELGKIDDFSSEDAKQLFHTLGMGALKYFLLKVDPKKRMMFNPQESIQFQGNTGPFIQYTHARIRAILRKATELGYASPVLDFSRTELLEVEKDLVVLLSRFPQTVAEAGNNYSPAEIANYVYELAKEYNRLYQEVSIFQETDIDALKCRLLLSYATGQTIKTSMRLLGIEVPERM
jgi:arginyl-tRNA synthetase